MFAILTTSLVVAYLLVVWFETHAVVEYAKIFNFTKLLKVDQYEEISEYTNQSYLEFLKEFYSDYFIVRLVSCPICLAEWLSAVISIPLGWLLAFPTLFLLHFAVAFLSLVLYYGFNLLRKHA